MTINNTTLGRVAYLGNGTATVFTVPFVFSNSSDLEVIRTVISTGVETVLTITSDYTVSGGGLIPATGSVTFLVAPTADHRITIRREVPNTQLVDFVENDTLPAAVQESALDKLTLQIQDLKENVDRAVLFTPGSGQSSVSIATAVPDYLLGWNSTGDIIESVDPSTLTGPAGPAGQGVPTGGTAGQILSKIDGTNFNTQWVTPSGGGNDKTFTFLPSSVDVSSINNSFIDSFITLPTFQANKMYKLNIYLEFVPSASESGAGTAEPFFQSVFMPSINNLTSVTFLGANARAVNSFSVASTSFSTYRYNTTEVHGNSAPVGYGFGIYALNFRTLSVNRIELEYVFLVGSSAITARIQATGPSSSVGVPGTISTNSFYTIETLN